MRLVDSLQAAVADCTWVVGTTMRRISANVPFMGDEEKKKLAEYMRKLEAQLKDLISVLEKGGSH